MDKTIDPRIEPVADPIPDNLAKQLAKVFPLPVSPPQLYLTIARNAGLFEDIVEMGLLGPTGLMDRARLKPSLRETIILRTCVATRNGYELNLHVRTISRMMGLSAEQIEDIRQPDPSPDYWPEEFISVMRLVDCLVRDLAVDDQVFSAARNHFDEAELIEITQLVGLYTGVAMLVALARPNYDDYELAKQLSGDQ